MGRRPEDPGRIHPRVRFVTVSSRRSPKHYGVRVFEDYDGTSELHWRGRDKKYVWASPVLLLGLLSSAPSYLLPCGS